MELLFVYGTLQDPEVQMRAFGRTTAGTPALLDGYRRDDITIDGSDYFIAVPDGASSIDGRVLEVTPAELIGIDQYEGKEYRRLRVTLHSGVEAWFYAE